MKAGRVRGAVISSLAVWSWGGLGCSQADTTELLRAGPRDGGPAQIPDVDIGPGPRDAAVPDADLEDAGPRRRLVPHNVLGATPVSNRVLNPTLDPFALLPMTLGSMARFYWPRTPAGLPVARLELRSEAFIPFQTGPASLTASLFVGRQTLTDRPAVQVSLLGVGPTQTEMQVDLIMDDTPQEIDGVTWYRFFGQTSESFIGSGVILVENDSDRPLFVHAPVVLAVQLQTRPRTGTGTGEARGPAGSLVRMEPLSASRRAAWSRLKAHHREVLRRRL